jgi:hypothetical protein
VKPSEAVAIAEAVRPRENHNPHICYKGFWEGTAMKVSYRGYRIEPKSHKLRSGSWSPHARIILHQRGKSTLTPVFSKRRLELETQKEADARAIELAKAFIDGSTSVH